MISNLNIKRTLVSIKLNILSVKKIEHCHDKENSRFIFQSMPMKTAPIVDGMYKFIGFEAETFPSSVLKFQNSIHTHNDTSVMNLINEDFYMKNCQQMLFVKHYGDCCTK